MGSRELLASVPGVRHLHIAGTAFDSIAGVALIAWTIALADAIAAVVERRPLTPALVIVFVLLAVRVGSRFVAARLLAASSSRVRTGVRAGLVSRWMGVADASSRGSSTGSDSTLLGPGVDALDEYLTRFLPARTLAIILPVIAFVVIGVLDPWTMLILLFAGPMLIVLLVVIGSRTRVLAERRFAELGWLRTFHLDMVRGIPTLKVFGRATESVTTIQQMSERFGRTTMGVLRTAFQTSLVVEWAATAATALVAVQVSLRMVDGDLDYLPALTVLMLTTEFFAPLRTLATEYHAGQAGNAVLARLSEIESPRTLPASVPGKNVDRLGTIRFESVGFTHPGATTPVFAEATFTIHPGETVMLIGPSGIGKSTVVDLLLGLVRPTSGRITIGGRPLDELDLGQWRRMITSIPQNPFIFHASVRDNVVLSDPDATDDAVDAALERALASGFVADLPRGLDAWIGEEGTTLSGGQRQRLAIARALLRDAPLALFDECTAHLDPVTESRVIGSIRPFLAERTALVVAHREATFDLADRVMTIRAGTIIEVDR